MGSVFAKGRTHLLFWPPSEACSCRPWSLGASSTRPLLSLNFSSFLPMVLHVLFSYILFGGIAIFIVMSLPFWLNL